MALPPRVFAHPNVNSQPIGNGYLEMTATLHRFDCSSHSSALYPAEIGHFRSISTKKIASLTTRASRAGPCFRRFVAQLVLFGANPCQDAEHSH